MPDRETRDAAQGRWRGPWLAVAGVALLANFWIQSPALWALGMFCAVTVFFYSLIKMVWP